MIHPDDSDLGLVNAGFAAVLPLCTGPVRFGTMRLPVTITRRHTVSWCLRSASTRARAIALEFLIGGYAWYLGGRKVPTVQA